MKKIRNKKKILLVFLLAVTILFVLSNYIKTTEIELNNVLDQNDESSQNNLLLEADKNTEAKKKPKHEKYFAENKVNSEVNSNKETQIETITLTEEIKDPFKRDQSPNNKAREKVESTIAEFEQVRAGEGLVFLERNIIEENLISQTKNSENMSQTDKEVKNKLELKDSKQSNTDRDNIKNLNKQKLKNIKLPFKLLGIIKSKNASSALFLYQGQTLLKKENDRIGLFKIEKINNKELTISYQKEKRIIHLWKEKNNEN